ncbi:MAG: [LysW]-aminoadipate kinase [Planctomycetes bacterium]|nr:[LysW]-aminoadipate kinase [Planctomycetota bacterium]MCB9904436.1 [LysW]-aminoadipate kinase [Planctomycetota bacterium]
MYVCKVGGSAGIDLDSFCDDVAQLVRDGQRMIVVHGGSHETNRVAEALGHPPRFITSPSGYTSRHTDRRTLEIFEMVYCGSVNKGLVERLQARGVNAVGLSGIDGRIWEGRRKSSIRAQNGDRIRIVRDSYTGRVERVNKAFLDSLLDQGMLPVLVPPAISFEGEAINVDGDRAAAVTAAAFGAEALLLLSNVPGLLADFPDEDSLIDRVERTQLDTAFDAAQGRMRIKLLAAQEALAAGVGRVVLGDARGAHPISRALAGAGTVVV